jgi:putative transcription factor
MDSVNCEICGRTIAKANRVKIEGTIMEVCNNCTSLGQKLEAPRQWSPRQQNLKLSQETVVDNFASLVKQAREKRHWTMEEFALRCQEKEMFLHRVEQGTLKPDMTLARKLERVLGIRLITLPSNEETTEEEKQPVEDTDNPTGLTLGDFIKVKKKK